MNDDEFRPNYKKLVEQYVKIAKEHFPNASDELIADASVGALVSVANGNPPSAILEIAAYSLGVSPMPNFILEYAYRKVK